MPPKDNVECPASLLASQAALEEQQCQPGYAAFLQSKTCLTIKEVLGVCFVNPEALSEGEQRGGVEPEDYSHEYLVRGGFGDAGDAEDALMPGTRWVGLAELMASDNCSANCKLLSAFDEQLAGEMRDARRLRQEELAERAEAVREAVGASG